MEIVYVLLPLSLLLALLGLGAYLWSVKSGQYDDLDGDRLRVLLDEEKDARTSQGEKGADDEPGA